MIESISSFFHSDTFLIPAAFFFLIDGFLCLVVSIWIGRNSFMKKMDMLFLGHSTDSGIRLNILDAGSYGTAMLFPKSYGKRVYKHVDISAISLRDKWPYMLYTSILLSSIPYMIFFTYLEWTGKLH